MSSNILFTHFIPLSPPPPPPPEECNLFISTGGPRYMRSFYLQIRVYAIEKYSPKSVICDIFSTYLAYMRFLFSFFKFDHKFN
jgi:hypothetical protein